MEAIKQSLYLTALAGRAKVFRVTGALDRSRVDFEGILRLTRDDELKRDALVGLCMLFSELSDYDREAACAGELIKLTRNMDLCSRGRALMANAGALRDRGEYRSALKVLMRSVELYQLARQNTRSSREKSRALQEDISDVCNSIGSTYNLQGKYGPALKFYNKSLEMLKRLNNRMAVAQLLNNIGFVFWRTAAYKKARDCFNESLEIAQEIGYRHAVSTILGNLGLVYNEIDKPQNAIEYFRRAINISKEMGNKAGTANNLNNIGISYVDMYDYVNAIKYYNLSLALNRKINNKFSIAMTLSNIGRAYHDMGEYSKAFVYEKEAEKIASSAGILEIMVRCWILKGRILAIRKKYPEGIALLKKAIGLTEENKMDDLRISAVEQLVLIAVEGKNKAYLVGVAKYVAQLEKTLKSAAMDYDKCSMLAAIIDYNISEERYEEARKKLSELSNIARKINDRRFAAETFYLRAKLNRLPGKKYIPYAMKARDMAKKFGFLSLINELNTMLKKK